MQNKKQISFEYRNNLIILIAQITGLNGNTKMNTLNQKQFDSVVMGIRTMEGWIAGKVKKE